MPKRKPPAPRLIAVGLSGTALRHARQRTPVDEAIADLLEISEGHHELVVAEAARHLGGTLANPSLFWASGLAAGLLIKAAGYVDLDVENFRAQAIEAYNRANSVEPPRGVSAAGVWAPPTAAPELHP